MKLFKIIIPFSLLHFTCCISAFAQWTLTTLNNNYSFQKILFTTDSTGYATAKNGVINGVILKTTNRGNSWDSTGFNNAVLSIYFPNKDTGYAGVYNNIYKTTDGGSNWYELSYSFGGGLCGKGLFFLDSKTGYYGCGGGSILYKTIDGGNTWTSHYFGANSTVVEGIYFFNKDTGFIAGWYGPKIAKTTDGGNSWVDLTNAFTVNSMQFTSKTLAYAVGANSSNKPVIIKTTDGGDTWNVKYTEAKLYSFSSIYCFNDVTCYAVADSGTILKTTDGGNTWSKQVSGTTTKLNSVYCTDANTCYIVGDSGIILKTTNGGGVGIAEKNFKKSEVIIYPNPFSNSTTIEITNEELRMKSYDLQFTIYDLPGRAVKQLNNITIEQFSIDRKGLTDGIYFYQLKNKNQILSIGKLIIY